jgi:hypothetical protein
VVTEAFVQAVWNYRRRGGRLYKLAHDHGITPSLLSATITGARRVPWDDRVVAIGVSLGLNPDDVFVDEPEAVAS